MSYSGERDNFAPHMALVPMVIESRMSAPSVWGRPLLWARSC